jgi:ribose-phosphate pyrophosphokinase
MDYSVSSKLGILACPGGEKFADKVTERLKVLYRKRFERKTSILSRRYEMQKETVIRQINLMNDMQTSGMYNPGAVNKFRAPEYRVKARYTCFPNGELKTEILESVRGRDLYIFQDVENNQPLSFNEGKTIRTLSVNDHVFSLFVTADAAMQAGAESVTLVLPVYPYSRQHKKKGREGLTASRLGQMIEGLGVSRIITLDIHSREIENSFNHLRIDNLHASYQIIRSLSKLVDVTSPDLVVVSPDTGAVDRNKFYASSLEKPLNLLYKERDYSRVTQDANNNNITSMKLLGDVRGKIVFMADDMLGTGGTLLKAMEMLKDSGATKIIVAVSLPFFSGGAIANFEKAYQDGLFYRIIGTNAVYHEELLTKQWYINTDVTDLFAHIISRLFHNRSLSPLLDNRDIILKLLKK